MILLDTLVWWWAATEVGLLSAKAEAFIRKTKPEDRAIASISLWEFAMMASRGRIQLKMSPEKWLDRAINETGLTVLALTPRTATEACNLPGQFHKDPADRIIVATARIHQATVISKDEKILSYRHVAALW